ncbi:SGNH/GDSL hydrolase family protein [Engelhardtia mirabilis]|uniref:SGNH hydrolase-type esterase domain-containing protein n=1 Tax=Engelhardtia mirabilis TaxID=2528011 RepID=A0A518BRT5_9BACT|nr:hypothetical protein Pla133_47970 [Planctomycetes bacterium Pla133]QDV04002.1 hypothetical protein Pla86_47950 [Planctomycetes bacterium Pla86]
MIEPHASQDDAGRRFWIGARTVVVVVALLSLELGLYHVGDFGKRTIKERTERYGWVLVPNQSKWGLDAVARERINAQGFRDERDWAFLEAEAEREEGRHAPLKVAVLGNSLTFGSGVTEQQTWPRVLEQLLNDELDARGEERDVFVLNFAVEAYTLEQMARTYEDRIRPFEPDLLLWATVAKDIRFVDLIHVPTGEAPRRFESRTAIFAMLNEHVINRWIPLPTWRAKAPAGSAQERFWTVLLGGSQAVLLELLGQERGAAALASLSATVAQRYPGAAQLDLPGIFVECFEQVAREFVEEDRRGALVLALYDVFEAAIPPALWNALETDIVPNPFAPRYAGIWRIRGYRVATITRELESRSARLALAVMPTIIQVQHTPPSPLSFWRDQWLPEVTAAGLRPLVIDAAVDYLEQMTTLREEIARRGMLMVDGRATIGADYAGADESLARIEDPWHYSAAGHRVVATTIARRLIEEGVVDELLAATSPRTTEGN